MMTDLQLLYLLAIHVAEHLESHEDKKDSGILPSDRVRALMKEMEENLYKQKNSTSPI
jgi:hypothetical protein